MIRLKHAFLAGAFALLMTSPGSLAQQKPGSEPAPGAGKQQEPGRDRGPSRQGRSGRSGGQDSLQGITKGSAVQGFADLSAHSPDGTPVKMMDLVPAEGHLVIVTGCLTCPKFLQSYRDVEAIAHDYRSTEHPVAFVYLYKALAHPENGGWIQSYTLEERLHQVKAAAEELKTKVPFVCDGMDNSVSHALGGSPNSFLVLKGDGTVVAASRWAENRAIRASLAEAVGPSPTTSTPEDIGVPPFKRPSRAASSEVPRVNVSGTMHALKTSPAKSELPHYVKLRSEVEPGVLQGSEGKMYLGFHIDPVHETHWNNLVDPVAWTITMPEGVSISPATGTGPKITAPTDMVPREFMLDVTQWPTGQVIEVEVRYFACSDTEGWCKPVTQNYTVALERDRDAGMAQGRWQRPGRGGDAGRSGGAGDTNPMARMDRNGDGKLSRDEVRGGLAQRFDEFDVNSDGLLDEEEMKPIMERMRERGGPGGRSGRSGRGGRGGGGRPGGGGD